MDIIVYQEQHAARRRAGSPYAILSHRNIHAVEVLVYLIQTAAIPLLIVTTLAAVAAVVLAQMTRLVQVLVQAAVAVAAMLSANPIICAIAVKLYVVELVIVVIVILPVPVHQIALILVTSAGKVNAHFL